MAWPTEKVKLWASIAYFASLAGLFLAIVATQLNRKNAQLAAERMVACGELGLQAVQLDRCAASPEGLEAAQEKAARERAGREFPSAVQAVSNALHPLLAPFDSGSLVRTRQIHVPMAVQSWCVPRQWGKAVAFNRKLIGLHVSISAALSVQGVRTSGDELAGYDVSVSSVQPGGADISCPASISQLPPEQRKELRHLCDLCGVKAWGTLRLLEASFWEQNTFALGIDIEGLDVWPPSPNAGGASDGHPDTAP